MATTTSATTTGRTTTTSSISFTCTIIATTTNTITAATATTTTTTATTTTATILRPRTRLLRMAAGRVEGVVGGNFRHDVSRVTIRSTVYCSEAKAKRMGTPNECRRKGHMHKDDVYPLSLIHISEPTRPEPI
eukprot:3947157-Pyramimonas_sp.AAC.2